MTTEPILSEVNKERLDRARAVFIFRRTLTPESDRGCALIASAYLDAELEKLLRGAVVENIAVANALFSQSRALSSFSSKIDLAYLLGLIDPTTRQDLDLIRKIRNEFGHDHAPISFDTPKIADRCRSLVTQGDKSAEPRKMFVRAAMVALASIHTGYFIRNRAHERQVSNPITTDQWLHLKSEVLKEFESVISRYGADYDSLDEALLKKFWGWKDLRRPPDG